MSKNSLSIVLTSTKPNTHIYTQYNIGHTCRISILPNGKCHISFSPTKKKLFLYFSLLHKKLFKFRVSSPRYAFILSNHILSRLLTIPTPCHEFFHLCIMYHFLYYSIHFHDWYMNTSNSCISAVSKTQSS